MNSSPLYWILWLMTAGVIVREVYRAAKSPHLILGFPLVASAMFAYFYVAQSFIVATNLSYLLKPWMLEIGQATALAGYLLLIAGWYSVDQRRVVAQTKQPPRFATGLLWQYGLMSILLGIAGMQSFMRYSADYTQSAYWYLLFHIAYPGLLLCVQVVSCSKRYQNQSSYFILGVLSVILLLPWILGGRRGPMFPFMIVIVYGSYLARRLRPSVPLMFGSLLGVGLLMLTFFALRTQSGSQNMIEATRTASLDPLRVVFGKAYEPSDNEFLYHCGLTSTCISQSRYQWGTGYLSLLTHWVPRQIWPDKPGLGEGWFPRASQYIPTVTGWEMTRGAASSGVAETIHHLGPFAALFWFGFGRICALAFWWSRFGNDPRPQALYVGLLAASHWLIAQGFTEAFVPMVFYIIWPQWIYQTARVETLETAQRPVPIPRLTPRTAASTPLVGARSTSPRVST